MSTEEETQGAFEGVACATVELCAIIIEPHAPVLAAALRCLQERPEDLLDLAGRAADACMEADVGSAELAKKYDDERQRREAAEAEALRQGVAGVKIWAAHFSNLFLPADSHLENLVRAIWGIR